MTDGSGIPFSDDGWSVTPGRPEARQRPDLRGATSIVSSAQALDRAFAGEPCRLLLSDGSSRLVRTHRWSGEASTSDLALFVDPCDGPTLDVGCGPGRLAAALTGRGLEVLGVDISQEAVRQTRRRGAPALCHDILAEMPRPRTWRHVLLADGNIGIGGDPARLLSRLASLLEPTGTVIVEVADAGDVTVQHARLRVGQQVSGTFAWATVGVDAVATLAAAAGLEVGEIRVVAGRRVATLQHRGAPGGVPAPRTCPAR